MKFAPAVGQKFNQDGSVRYFPGNTFVCHIDEDNPVYSEILWAQQQLKNMHCAEKFAFLPSSSIHMTLFEGLCDQVRKQESWSTKLALDTTLEESSAFIIEQLSAMTAIGNLNLLFDTVYNSSVGGTLLRLMPSDFLSEQALKQSREKLSELTGIRQTNHDSYRFHVSLSYKLIELDEEDELELLQVSNVISQRLANSFGLLKHNSAAFCKFDNMFLFEPLHHLKL